jgi:hypothetical protein
MNATAHVAPPHAAPIDVDWPAVARAAVGSAFVAGLVGGFVAIAARLLSNEDARALVEHLRKIREASERGQNAAPEADATSDGGESDDDEAKALEAALLLGVRLDASEDEIRAALRARLRDSGIHPDHGGDGEEAKRLIAARNLLAERARARVRP